MGWGGIILDIIEYKPPPSKYYASITYTSEVHVYKSILHKTVDTGLRVLFVDITFTKLPGLPYIGEELPVQREVNNIHDDFAVAVLKNSSVVSHVPREISRVCWYFLHKSGSEKTCSHKLTLY